MDFNVLIQKDGEGYYVSEVLELSGCHTQGKTMKELMERTKEAVECYLEGGGEIEKTKIVGLHKIPI
jgi:predicted RNase H-like HicB family nuclease